MGLNLFTESHDCIESALKSDQNNPDYLSAMGIYQYLCFIALVLRKLGKLSESIHYYDLAIKINPKNSILYNEKGNQNKKINRINFK